MELKICPRCGKGVEPKDYVRSGVSLVGGTDPRIRCRKCGYVGLLIVLDDEEEQE